MIPDDPRVVIVIAFIVSASLSMFFVAIKSKIRDHGIRNSRLSKVLFSFFVIIAASFLAAFVTSDYAFRDISTQMQSTNIDENYPFLLIIAVSFGFVPPLIAHNYFRGRSNITNKIPLDLQVASKGAIVLFSFTMIFMLLIVSIVLVPLALPIWLVSDASELETQECLLVDSVLTFTALSSFIVAFVATYLVWLPIMFLIYLFKDSILPKKSKVTILLTIFGIIAVFSLYSSQILGVGSGRAEFAVIVTPLFGAFLIAFFAAEGILDTISENAHKFRKNLNHAKRIGMFAACIFLIWNFFVLADLFFLIGAPFDFSPVDELKFAISGVLSPSSLGSDLKEGATFLIYSGIVLGFFLYDMIIILRGFSSEFASKKSSIFRTLTSKMDDRTAVVILANLILLSAVSIFFVNPVISLMDSLPSESEGSGSCSDYAPEFSILTDEASIKISTVAYFIQGTGFVAGLVYFIWRSRKTGNDKA